PSSCHRRERSPQQVPPVEVDERDFPDRRLDLVDQVVVEREGVGPVAGLDPELVEAWEGGDAGGGDPPGADRWAGGGDPAGADRGGDDVVPQQLTGTGPVGHDSSSAAAANAQVKMATAMPMAPHATHRSLATRAREAR